MVLLFLLVPFVAGMLCELCWRFWAVWALEFSRLKGKEF